MIYSSVTDYFGAASGPTFHFDNNRDQQHVMAEDGNSSISASPISEGIALDYTTHMPQNVQLVPSDHCIMNGYDYGSHVGYSLPSNIHNSGTNPMGSAYSSQPVSLGYSSSFSPREQMYIPGSVQFTSTSSPTSSLSSSSMNHRLANQNGVHAAVKEDDNLLFDDTIHSQNSTEPNQQSAASEAYYQKRRLMACQYNSMSMDETSYINGNAYEDFDPQKRPHSYGLHSMYGQSYGNSSEQEAATTHHSEKRLTRNKGKKRCNNCRTTTSPSWRRSISKVSKGDLLCNACGLYEKTAKKKRMLVTNDEGLTKVVRKRDARGYTCSKCDTKEATRWRKMKDGTIHCAKCIRGSK